MLKKRPKFLFIFASLQIHFWTIVLMSFLNLPDLAPELVQTKPLKIQNMRTVGREDSMKKNLTYIEVKKKTRQPKKVQLKDLSFAPLKNLSLEKFKRTRPGKESLLKRKQKVRKKKFSINNTTIKEFLQSTPKSLSSAQQLAKLDDANVVFDLEVPKGVKEDQLNKHELVFYSFRKRTAIAYVNAFQKNLNQFETKNPHLQFPLTKDSQTIAGKITYDKNGDILKIQTLKYTQIKKLQDFFMDVLQDMDSLPNPPKEVINSQDQFVINFILSINN